MKRKNNIIKIIMLIVFIVLFLFSGNKIVEYIYDEREIKKIEEETSNYIMVQEEKIIEEAPNNIIVQKKENEKEKYGISRYNIDFESLKGLNGDTVGFLKVNGTNIEHIVVKGDNNSYYLTHNFNKEKSTAGWIFADYKNKFDGTDKNIVIYGHNMKNGTMFASLKNVLSNEWHNAEENMYITLLTEKSDNMYKIFSIYQIENEEYYIKTDFAEGEFSDFLTTIKERSMFDMDTIVDETDTILTLSTCGTDINNRIVIHAKKIK